MADRWRWRRHHCRHLDSRVRPISPCNHKWFDTRCEPSAAPHVYIHKRYTHAPAPFVLSEPDRERWQRVVWLCRYWFGTYTGARMQLPRCLGCCEFRDADSALPLWDGWWWCEHYSDYNVRTCANCTSGTMISFECHYFLGRYLIYHDMINAGHSWMSCSWFHFV